MFYLLAFILLLLAFPLPMYFRWKSDNLRRYEECAARFYKKSDALLSDDETPTHIIETIETLNHFLSRKDGADLVFFTLFRKPDDDARAKSAIEFDEKSLPFITERPELAKAYLEAITSCFLAMVWNGRGIKGMALKSVFRNSVSAMDMMRAVRRIQTVEVKQNNNGNHHHHQPAVAG